MNRSSDRVPMQVRPVLFLGCVCDLIYTPFCSLSIHNVCPSSCITRIHSTDNRKLKCDLQHDIFMSSFGMVLLAVIVIHLVCAILKKKSTLFANLSDLKNEVNRCKTDALWKIVTITSWM